MVINIRHTVLYFGFGIVFILMSGVYFTPAIAGDAESITGSSTLESRVKKLEDREEIRELLIDYGRFLDQRDFHSFSELFARTEGEWIGGMGRARGEKAIRELMERTIGKGAVLSRSCHLFTNEKIHVDGDRASSVTKWIFVVSDEANRPRMYFVGHYDDSMIRENGRWKFLRRGVHADIPADDQVKSGSYQ